MTTITIIKGSALIFIVFFITLIIAIITRYRLSFNIVITVTCTMTITHNEALSIIERRALKRQPLYHEATDLLNRLARQVIHL
jgi:hypothetical protein